MSSLSLDDWSGRCWLIFGNVLLGSLEGHLLEVLLGTRERSRWLRRWGLGSVQVLIRVESTNGRKISDVSQLQEGRRVLSKSGYAILTIILLLVLMTAPLLLRMSHFLRHGRKSDTFGKIWERINKTSFFSITMIE